MKTTEEFKRRTEFEIGSGSRVSFWKDHRCSDRPLLLESLSLFNLVNNKDAKVVDSWVPLAKRGAWNIGLGRSLYDLEMETMTDLIDLLGNVQLQPDMEDSIKWIHSHDGKFSVKSFKEAQWPRREPTQSSPLRWKIWKLYTPSNVSFLIWTCHKRSFPTIDVL